MESPGHFHSGPGISSAAVNSSKSAIPDVWPLIYLKRAARLMSRAAARRAKHPVNPSAQKHSTLPNFGYSAYSAHPARHKGRFAIVTRRGQGGGGRDGVGAHSKLQGGTPSMVFREQRERGTTRR
jgi:hypothetical protein